MSTSVTRSPSMVVDDGQVGTKAWSDPENAVENGDAYATVSGFGNQQSHLLMASDFGFEIPEGATIDGIIVEVKNKASVASNNVFSAVAIVKGGNIGVQNRRSDDGYITTTEKYNVFGSDSQLWGEEWTPADINDPGFGVALHVAIDREDDQAAVISINHVRCTIHYSV